MANDFNSTPYDGNHPVIDPGNDWRSGNGPLDVLQRMVSYGNWAGPDNRMEVENREEIARRRQADPSYDPYTDPAYMQRYAPTDPTDAAAQRHDHSYFTDLRPGDNMFGWDGLHDTRNADRALVRDVQAEMAANGGRYSETAQTAAQGLRGFFGARVMGQDAADWAGGRAGEAQSGIANFVQGAGNWSSLDEAGQGITQGLTGAGSWLADTGTSAWNGVQSAYQQNSDLGTFGTLCVGAGLANVAGAGAVHLAGEAWDGAQSAGSNLYNWVTQ